MCGLACAALGAAHVVLTDLPESLPLLRRNAAASAWATAVEVRALRWGVDVVDELRADFVIACDCLYQPRAYPRLVDTLVALGSPTLVAWRPRDRHEDEFLRLLAASGWALDEQARQPAEPGTRVVLARPLRDLARSPTAAGDPRQ